MSKEANSCFTLFNISDSSQIQVLHVAHTLHKESKNYHRCVFSVRTLNTMFHLPFQAVSRHIANRMLPAYFQPVWACEHIHFLCGQRLHWKYNHKNSSRVRRSLRLTFFPLNAGEQACLPWFWICREINCGCRGPSGEEPFTQRLMSVKGGSDAPVNLQPLLMPLEMM